MNLRTASLLLTLAVACMAGCQSDEATQPAATHPGSSGKPQTPMLTPIDGTATLTEDSLRAIDKEYSCELPGDYRKFLLQNNGGFPSPDCVTFTESDRKTASDVFCFLAMEDERAWASMDWHHETYSGRLPPSTLPIARDSCGNLWLLSVGSKNAGSVYFWDHGSYDTFDETDIKNWPRVADSFQDFLGKIGTYDASIEDGGVISRYAIVEQATEGMSKNDAGFSTQANPGFVWHCDCDDDGSVSMQFVQYEVHAVATHTDGYSRVRAANGLIKEGQSRLPQ